jgi:radical SAM-linked protein
LAFRYAIEGDVRYISHHDSLRLFERGLVRAGLPVRYSEGFNPRPRMSIVLPRSVGMAGRDELLIVEMTEPVNADAARRLLEREVPDGVSVLTAELLDDGVSPRALSAEYSMMLEPALAEAVKRQAEELLDRTRIEVERQVPKHNRCRKVDIRPYLVDASVRDGCLRWTQTITPAGTARPEEVLAAVGLSGHDYLHRVCRERVRYGA